MSFFRQDFQTFLVFYRIVDRSTLVWLSALLKKLSVEIGVPCLCCVHFYSQVQKDQNVFFINNQKTVLLFK